MKPFKEYKDQIKILRSRKLIINNEEKAMEILKDTSLSYEEQKNKVNALLKQFLEKTFHADFSGYVY